MGELSEVTAYNGDLTLIFEVIALASIGLFALIQSDAGNDDDDSGSGGNGGLMQPVGTY